MVKQKCAKKWLKGKAVKANIKIESVSNNLLSSFSPCY